jgi:hypothetical protein
MSFLVQLLKAIAVLVPDFLTLGLVASAFFTLCCIARTLGIAGAVDNALSLKISLALGYLVTIVINIVESSVQTPARPTVAAAYSPVSSAEHAVRESSSTRRPQPLGHEGVVTQS